MVSRLSFAGALVALVAAASLLASCRSASAQTFLGPPSGISAGVFIPSDGKAKQGGNTQFNADLRYSFTGIPMVNSRTLVDLGYEGGSDNGHSTIVPLTIGEYFGSGKVGSSPYIGGGIGGYYMDQSGESATGRFGGYVAAGWRWTALFVEAKYQIVHQGDGLLLNVGVQF